MGQGRVGGRVTAAPNGGKTTNHVFPGFGYARSVGGLLLPRDESVVYAGVISSILHSNWRILPAGLLGLKFVRAADISCSSRPQTHNFYVVCPSSMIVRMHHRRPFKWSYGCV